MGVIEGFGKTKFPEGKTYEGQWKNNLPHGNGKMTWKNGDSFEGRNKKYKIGMFVQEQIKGEGKFWKKTGEYFEGKFNK